jgi:DNA-binding protein YbaB
MLDKLKDMYQLQKQAREMQARLAQERVEGVSRDGSFRVALNGNQEVLSVSVAEQTNLSRELVEQNMKEAFSDALSKLKNLLASKMREIM